MDRRVPTDVVNDKGRCHSYPLSRSLLRSCRQIRVWESGRLRATSSGLGTGQAAALNQDGGVNSAANPAPAESIVTLYATGLGQTTPAGEDGAIPGAVLPQPELPISITIGGLPAYVVYVGAAPGMVEGVFQINVRIPPLAAPTSIAIVALQVGSAVSQADVWIAVQ